MRLEGGEQPCAGLSNLDFRGKARDSLAGDPVISGTEQHEASGLDRVRADVGKIQALSPAVLPKRSPRSCGGVTCWASI